MLVVIFVAGVAIPGGLFVTRCFVAALAGNGHMAPRQWKTGKSMVKICAFPGFVGMAVFALGPQTSLVFVIFLVATQAVQWRIAETFQVLVAGNTLD